MWWAAAGALEEEGALEEFPRDSAVQGRAAGAQVGGPNLTTLQNQYTWAAVIVGAQTAAPGTAHPQTGYAAPCF